MKIDNAGLMHLVALSRRGDRGAYAALLKGCADWLARYYARRVPPAVLDDLVQETLISLHGKLSSYDPERPFLPWLAAIARYRFVDHLRRITRASEVMLDDDVAAPPEQDAATARISLEGLFALIPPAQAQALELVKIEGCSIVEASRRSGQSEALVKVNIHRGLKKLAALIEKAD